MNDHAFALRLEYASVGYNLVEAVASIGFALAAGSIALLGFGLDSVVESLSGFVLIWRLYDHRTMSAEEAERKERIAVRFVGLSFLLLAAYVSYESIMKLIVAEAPDTSLPGIIIAAVSLALMPALARWKRRIGERIGSRALIADSRETLACSWLSAALLVGLGAHAGFGVWQADPIAGLIIVAFLVREGIENLRGETCGDDDDCGDACHHEGS
jgi:divalent metal cation (Fe/Co/Zn/Cd) transporter